ncbi:SRPBCC family protein [Actinocrispum wychmicini]|uniref:Activator of Hsp90 ATPase-like protein n=1 Tax=Actinocrispum wychmicini TaxID=1213861 RepID=A0A4R2K2X6_9PSEU|nr:SRPBCC domain-containing protein [Actinocrispum wychmicini]TCO60655.1 activator of Hsp90 ATPase-like protein [Actinocrispum wychmicini]
MTDYTTKFTVEKHPSDVFRAVTNVRGWWSEEIDGPTDQVGGRFEYHYQDVHRCEIEVTAAVPGRLVTWLVHDNYFDFITDQTEWTGTTVRFDILAKGDQTEVRFTHQGLVPAYECFDVCSNAWGFFVNTSLRDLITTGEGQPNKRDQQNVLAEQASFGA